MAGLSRALLIVSSLALGACAASTPHTQVTRFHLGQPLAPGQVAIEPLPGQAGLNASLEFEAYSRAVGAELTRLGYTVAPGVNNSELVASIGVARGTRETQARSPVSVGLGGGSFGGSTGIGGGVSFPIGGGARDMVVTELAVQLKRRSEGSVVWEGRAQTAARQGTPYADPAQAVTRLAQALFSGFPGESGKTIEVK